MRDSEPNLKAELIEHPERFEFFEAARILHLMSLPDAPGRNTQFRFHTAPRKSFPAGEVDSIFSDGSKLHLFTNVIGLFGPLGVLPHVDKELVTGGNPNLMLRDFLDVFNTRIIRALFDAWKTNRQDVALEMFRRKVDSREDGCTMVLLALCGLAIPTTRQQHLFSDEVYAASAGLLSRTVRSASSIRRCIASQFNLPVTIHEFISERIFLPVKIQTRLGGAGEAYHRLGTTAILGPSVDSHRQRFEVQLGPLTREQFYAMCPYGEPEKNLAFRRLVDLIKGILGRPLDFDIRFSVRSEVVEPSTLSFDGATRLGFDSWLVTEPTDEQRADPVKRFAWDTVSI